MTLDPTYECDAEFVKLMTRRRDIDLTRAALELARDAYPDLDFGPTLQWIDGRGAELVGGVARARDERAALDELAACLGQQHDLCGTTAAYEQPDSSYLHRVVETRRGLPISLSILYMAVGRRVGMDLKGVAAPMHFLTRCESVEGPLFIDAYTRGRILTYKECLAWMRQMSHLSPARIKSCLEPAGPRCIVIRMLNNLKALYARQDRWTAAWHVQHRLTALQPTSYQERRDLALISLRANRPGTAIELFQSCLPVCPADERELLEVHLRTARSEVHRWN